MQVGNTRATIRSLMPKGVEHLVKLRLFAVFAAAATMVAAVALAYMIGRVDAAAQTQEIVALVKSEEAITLAGFFPVAKPAQVTVTGYAPDPSLTDSTPFVTAAGFVTGRRICASDPAAIPSRSFVWIPDLGLCFTGDTGKKVKGLHVDWAFSTKDEAIDWGRKKRVAWIVTPEMLERAAGRI